MVNLNANTTLSVHSGKMKTNRFLKKASDSQASHLQLQTLSYFATIVLNIINVVHFLIYIILFYYLYLVNLIGKARVFYKWISKKQTVIVTTIIITNNLWINKCTVLCMYITYIYVGNNPKIVLRDIVIDIGNLPKEIYKIRPSL